MLHHLARKSSRNNTGFCLLPVLGLSFVMLFYVATGRSADEAQRESSPRITMEIYFVPFDAQTALPISMNDIEQRSLYKFVFIHESELLPKDHPLIPRLRKMFLARRGTEEIDNLSVRLKVKVPNETFYVDKNGRVLQENTGGRFKLSKKEMKDIEKSIEYFSGVVDVKASKKISP